jgi:hypothetical protein
MPPSLPDKFLCPQHEQEEVNSIYHEGVNDITFCQSHWDRSVRFAQLVMNNRIGLEKTSACVFFSPVITAVLQHRHMWSSR